MERSWPFRNWVDVWVWWIDSSGRMDVQADGGKLLTSQDGRGWRLESCGAWTESQFPKLNGRCLVMVVITDCSESVSANIRHDVLGNY